MAVAAIRRVTTGPPLDIFLLATIRAARHGPDWVRRRVVAGMIGLKRASRLAATVRVGKGVPIAQGSETWFTRRTMTYFGTIVGPRGQDGTSKFDRRGEIACLGYGRHL